MNKPISAKGERQAIGGFLPQFGEFAWLAYRQLLHNSLEWVRVADPEAQQLDDILYATPTTVFAYQVKWTISGAAISLNDFSQLLPSLVSSWQGLRTKLRWSRQGGQKKDVYFFCYGNQNERGVARQTA